MNAKQFLERIRDNKQEMKEMLNAYYHHTFPDSKDDFSTTVTYTNGKYIAAGCAEGEVSEERMLELAEWYKEDLKMERYDYRYEVTGDIQTYIVHNLEYLRENVAFEDLEKHLNEALWNDDVIAAGGSYAFTQRQAEDNLRHNHDLLQEAIEEFGASAELFTPEACDVAIRRYILSECIAEVIDDLDCGDYDGIIIY